MLSRSNLTGASWDEVWAISESTPAPTADRRAPGRSKKKTSSSSSKRQYKTKYNNNHPTPHDSFACTTEDPPDPLCDLYFRGFSSSFDDIMDVYQKDGQYRESHTSEIKEQQYEDSDDYSDDRNNATNSNSNSNNIVTKVDNNAKEGWAEESPSSSSSSSSESMKRTQLLNIGAYLISGIIMIFILECFIKMGMAISMSSRSLYG